LCNELRPYPHRAREVWNASTDAHGTWCLTSPSGGNSILTSVIRTNSFRGLWLGQTLATLIRETGGGAAWFASKEAVATLLLKRRHVPSKDKKELRPWESAVSGATAGIAYNRRRDFSGGYREEHDTDGGGAASEGAWAGWSYVPWHVQGDVCGASLRGQRLVRMV